MHQQPIEVEQDRGVDPAQVLFTNGQVTIGDHEKAIGLGLHQGATQQKPQIRSPLMNRQGIPRQQRQHAEGITMAFQLQIQIGLGIKGNRPGHGDDFLALSTPQSQIQADRLTLDDERSLLQLQRLARQAGIEHKIRDQQRSLSVEVITPPKADAAAELRRHRCHQRQQRQRNPQQREVSGSTTQRATKGGDHRFQL